MRPSGKRVQLVRWLRVKECIKNHGRINKWDLQQVCNISRSTYEKEAPFWLHTFPDFVDYDRCSGDWIWKVVEGDSEDSKEIPLRETIQITTDWESEL